MAIQSTPPRVISLITDAQLKGDTNKDGKLSRNEFKNYINAKFNGNLKITLPLMKDFDNIRSLGKGEISKKPIETPGLRGPVWTGAYWYVPTQPELPYNPE